MTDAVELARIVNIAVLIVTLVVLGTRVNKWWCNRWRCLMPAAGTGFLAVTISASSVDHLLHDRPGGVATFLILIAGIALLMQALTIAMGRGDKHEHGGVLDITPPRSEREAPHC